MRPWSSSVVALLLVMVAGLGACEVEDLVIECTLQGSTSHCTLADPSVHEPNLGIIERAADHVLENGRLVYTMANIYPLKGHYLLVDPFVPNCTVRNLTITYDLGPFEVVVDNASIPHLPLPDDLVDLGGRIMVRRTVLQEHMTVIVPLRRSRGGTFTERFDLFLGLYAAAVVIILLVFSRSMDRRKRDEERPRATREDFSYLLTMLTSDEEEVLNTLLDTEGMTQRMLRRETGFSAPKLTRILAGLENRNIIRREPVGRTKKVFLSGEIKYQRRGM